MDWITNIWHSAEYKTKFYIFSTAIVLLLFAGVFLLTNIRFYKNGAGVADLTQRNGDAITVHNGGIVTIVDTYPPFEWMGPPPSVSVPESDLPYQNNGIYIVEGRLEDVCLRLIQAGFVFDISCGGTMLVSELKACFLYYNDRTLIAKVEDIRGN